MDTNKTIAAVVIITIIGILAITLTLNPQTREGLPSLFSGQTGEEGPGSQEAVQCLNTCSSYGFETWKLQQDEEGVVSCLCVKEVCTEEETASAITRFCNDKTQRFYFE